MSIPEFRNMKCGNCGHTSEIMEWDSPESFGKKSLDTRPAEDYKITLPQALVRKCGNCGYCSSDIENITENLELIIKSEKYQHQLNNKQFPQKANEFLCKSIILESNNQLEEAALASLHAAWDCDDNDNYVQSKFCRTRAFDLFQLANISNSLNFEKEGEYPALAIDLLRKMEQFGKAHSVCILRLQKEKDELLVKILHFQNHLIENQDVKTYNIDDAVEYYENIFDLENEYCEEDDYVDEEPYYEPDNQDNDWKRDYFDAMTDGQLGDYDDFGGDIDDIDTWARG